MTGILGAVAAPFPLNSVFVQINDFNVDSSASGSATAGYEISSDGKVRNQALTILESWLSGGGSPSDYEVRATLTSGTIDNGTLNTWVNGSVGSAWTKTNGSRNGSTKTAIIFVEIRLASSHVVQDSATITLSAESLGGGGNL